MKILAADTSTLTGCIGLADGERVIAEVILNVSQTHSSRLMPAIDRMLNETEIPLKDIDAFAVALGPGSFTGLRIGMSTLQGLAAATGKRLVGVPSLEVLAWNAAGAGHQVCPMLDAKMGEVYAAIFEWNGAGFKKIQKETAAKVAEILQKTGSPTYVFGEGARVYEQEIRKTAGEPALFLPPACDVPRAGHLIHLAREAIERDDPEPVEPMYVRRIVAQKKQCVVQ